MSSVNAMEKYDSHHEERQSNAISEKWQLADRQTLNRFAS